MLEMFSGQNPLLLLVAVAGFWFMVRFVIAPRRGAPGLGALFRREAAAPKTGLGREAIASLLADSRQFSINEPGLRGLLLAGAFAAQQAEPSSPVVLIALADDPQAYRAADWLGRWPYPKRGHEVVSQEATATDAAVHHELTLKGAPPVSFHFLMSDASPTDAALEAAFEQGLVVIDDPAGRAAQFRQKALARRSEPD